MEFFAIALYSIGWPELCLFRLFYRYTYCFTIPKFSLLLFVSNVKSVNNFSFYGWIFQYNDLVCFGKTCLDLLIHFMKKSMIGKGKSSGLFKILNNVRYFPRNHVPEEVLWQILARWKSRM